MLQITGEEILLVNTVSNDGSILNQNLNGQGSSAIEAVIYAPWFMDLT